ncbi:hypothetical protein LRS74_29340 [Streptomyces sp. LX-29]|uniref:VMAP-C domain-containing protein n=1 Tax=Streptomyces sp. LX-29 TaxID=2900152 RepID=UPI00240DA061|nr:hypothetical protein [Streptomyces sp. LX-29]WFB10682.1 hypothetical protein LRS74_29340 [Streptomyces sp. LX-29]
MGWKQPPRTGITETTEATETGEAHADNGGVANSGVLVIKEFHQHLPESGAGPASPPPAAPRLDQVAWDRLGALFGDRPLPEGTYEAYRWAFEISGAVPPVGDSLPSGGLTEVVKDLDARQGVRPDMPLAVPFVRYLMERAATRDPGWATELAGWLAATCERTRVGPLPTPPPAERQVVLHLRLEPAQTEDRHWVRMWLHRGGFETLWESEATPLTLDEVRRELGRQLLRVERRFSETDPVACRRVDRVEFHVPFELLDVDFENWPMPIGRRGAPRGLGLIYQVAVRCPDERDGVTEALWRQKWRWYQAQSSRHPRAVHVLPDHEVSHVLGDRLQADQPPVCVLAEVSATRLQDALNAVLDAGVPIAVWRRGGPPRAARPGEGLSAALTTPGPDATGDESGIDVRRLPKLLRELRLEHADGAEDDQGWHHPLALLWDDPDCRPLSRSLS